MAAPHNRRLKEIQFTLNTINFECQLTTWELDPGEQDGDRRFTFCVDGEFIEETDPEPELTIGYFADFRSGGLSDFLWQNRGQEAAFNIVHHLNTPLETVQLSGTVRLKAPATGGEARETEEQEVTLLVTNLTYVRGA